MGQDTSPDLVLLEARTDQRFYSGGLGNPGIQLPVREHKNLADRSAAPPKKNLSEFVSPITACRMKERFDSSDGVPRTSLTAIELRKFSM
jgi:hypothetical protein